MHQQENTSKESAQNSNPNSRSAALLLGLGVALLPALAEAQLSKAPSVIMSKMSGKCMAVDQESTEPGKRAVQYACDTAGHFTWSLIPSGGYFRLVATHSGRDLSIEGRSMAREARAVQWTWEGADHQLWSIEPANDRSKGGFLIRAKHSGQCLSVYNQDYKTNGTSIVQWPCESTDNQVWYFGDKVVLPERQARLVSTKSGKCAAIAAGSKAAGAEAIQWTCIPGAQTEQESQKWRIRRRAAGYEIVSVSSQDSNNVEKCLSVFAESTADNAKVVQWPCEGGLHQIWSFAPQAAETSGVVPFRIVSAKSAKCLDVLGGTTGHAGLVQFACNGSTSQSWRVVNREAEGEWSRNIKLPVLPVAAANLTTGNVLIWSAYDQDTYDPNLGASGPQKEKTLAAVIAPGLADDRMPEHIRIDHPSHDMFCPGTSMLPDGSLLVNGGTSDRTTSIYRAGIERLSAGTWTTSTAMDMTVPRGYQANTVLDDGRVFTIGGSWPNGGGADDKVGEVWDSATNSWTKLTGAHVKPIIPNPNPDREDIELNQDKTKPAQVKRVDNHAWLFSRAGGTVFHAGPSPQMHWYTITGSGSYEFESDRGNDQFSINGTAVMYDDGLILKAGGASSYQGTGPTNQYAANGNSYSIDIRTGVTVTQLPSLQHPRAFQSGVVLADGRVVLVGGQSHPLPFTDWRPVLPVELFTPAGPARAASITQGASLSVPRTYHSIALLLPDGRVMAGGGGLCGVTCAQNHRDMQYYSPSYLFDANGEPAARPIIDAPSTLEYGKSVTVTSNRAVSAFTLVRLSAVTHTVNNDQRLLRLGLTSTGNTHTVQAPNNAGSATPGYYMLFGLTPEGVPSEAEIVQLK